MKSLPDIHFGRTVPRKLKIPAVELRSQHQLLVETAVKWAFFNVIDHRHQCQNVSGGVAMPNAFLRLHWPNKQPLPSDQLSPQLEVSNRP